MKRFLITAVCALLAIPAMAQEDALKDLPGYVFCRSCSTNSKPFMSLKAVSDRIRSGLLVCRISKALPTLGQPATL